MAKNTVTYNLVEQIPAKVQQLQISQIGQR